MPYQPIENYGVVGNMRTVALISTEASVDWFCFPRFDSPSIFGALLDSRQGGQFTIAPKQRGARHQQSYREETNVLITRFLSPDGTGEVIDFMPAPTPGTEGECRLIRRVKATRGTVALRLECQPAFNYGRDAHRTEITTQGAVFYSPTLNLSLATQVPLHRHRSGVAGEFVLREGQVSTLVIEELPAQAASITSHPESETDALLAQTLVYWRRWIGRCSYTGRWREMVHRSALALELLVYEPTGAVVAAPTTSLPERIGGERNWDYRCSWMRDSAFTVYALLRIGLTDEADRFMNWLESRCHEIEPNGSLQTVYGIDGRHSLTEETLTHWEGYRGSRPVRIGNAASRQLQLDIYGELMDAVYLYNKYGSPISSELWRDLRRLLDWVAENWRHKDNGIWEVRRGKQHFVYSKMMCWVALDRGLRLAAKRSLPADFDRWMKARDAIYQQILTDGWNAKRRAFVQSYGSELLDSSCLVMPLAFFMSPSDPKMLSTLDAICRPLPQGGLLSDGMVYRYNSDETEDGLEAGEGTFNMCTLWLVEALTRAGRTDPARLEQARLLFEKMLGQANHLGLYSEEAGPCGEALGNFPQAFTHLALISPPLISTGPSTRKARVTVASGDEPLAPQKD